MTEVRYTGLYRKRSGNARTGPPPPPKKETVALTTPLLVCYTAVFRVVTQRSSPLPLWGGALRDDTKNGCVADYPPALFPDLTSCEN